MRLGNVLRDQITIFLRDLCLFIYYPDTSTATRGYRLQYIQNIVIFLFSILHELIVIQRKYIGYWCHIKFLSELLPYSVYIFPKKIFSSQLNRSRKVINLLIFIHFFDFLILCVARPYYIPIIAFLNHLKTCIFECINNSIIYMCSVINSKSLEQILYIFSSINSNSVTFSVFSCIFRVGEKCSWRPLIKDRFQKIYFI